MPEIVQAIILVIPLYTYHAVALAHRICHFPHKYIFKVNAVSSRQNLTSFWELWPNNKS